MALRRRKSRLNPGQPQCGVPNCGTRLKEHSMTEYKKIWGSYRLAENNTEYRYDGHYTTDCPSNWEARMWPSNGPHQGMFNEYGITLSGPLGDVPADSVSLHAVVSLAVERAIAEWVSTTTAAKWIRWG
jgi:hypothetical protein